MNNLITLDENFSTTRRLIKADPQEIAGLVKAANKPDDKFETVLFLTAQQNRQGEGGLRTNGYFKTGGIIPFPMKDETTSPEAKQLITVITVVFNGEKFLEETILSVINQTYDNVEYIIIDGGSTDGSLDIIKKYEYAIDYWVSEKDKGIYDAMNKGLYLSMGGWVNFMNADDYLFDTFVLESIGFKEVYYNNSIIYGAINRANRLRMPMLNDLIEQCGMNGSIYIYSKVSSMHKNLPLSGFGFITMNGLTRPLEAFRPNN